MLSEAQPTPNGIRSATLSQIAKQAHVSISAVSRIIAGKKLHSFSEETIARVRGIAEGCRYRPNRLVRGMKTGRSGIVGVLIPGFDDFYSAITTGIHDALVNEDRIPVVLWSKQDSPSKTGRLELEQIHALVEHRVEGIILKPVFDAASDEYLHEILERNIPLVVVDRELPKVNCCYVGSDDETGVIAVLEHLLELGHRSIAYFGPTTIISTGMHRLLRFRTWMNDHPECLPSEHLIETWEPTVPDAIALLERHQRPSAVLAVNDRFAWRIYEAAREKGLRIPEDLSVAGFGNLPFAKYVTPPLTTLDQHPYEIGQSAVRRLLNRIVNPAERCRKVLIPPDLVVRSSTCPAPQGTSVQTTRYALPRSLPS